MLVHRPALGVFFSTGIFHPSPRVRLPCPPAHHCLQVREAVGQHLEHNPNAEILITGHSLGGALATLCFLDLQLTLGLGVGPKAVPFAPLYIFGSPRVGGLFSRRTLHYITHTSEQSLKDLYTIRYRCVFPSSYRYNPHA